MAAGHFKLDNLVALIDCNGIQADGPMVLDMEPVADKWRAFGWATAEINGNDMAAIVVALHEALDKLAVVDERLSQVITLRYFGGMTVPEVAKALGVSVVTVERDWRLGRAWLRGQLRD